MHYKHYNVVADKKNQSRVLPVVFEKNQSTRFADGIRKQQSHRFCLEPVIIKKECVTSVKAIADIMKIPVAQKNFI